jgi:uncharacterized membrane protein YgdD (TMEM256/DUF423 family)
LSFKQSPYTNYVGLPLTATTILFAGGIYYSVLTQKDENERIEWIGKVMPYNGAAMIAAYVVMAFI